MREGRAVIRAAMTAAVLGVSLALVSCAASANIPDDVKRVMADKCWSCHSDAKAASWKASGQAAANAMIDRMVARGAVITPAEREILISYFLR